MRSTPVVGTDISGQAPGRATDAQNAAYRAGLCIDCRRVRYSPGRPRCEQCHRHHMTTGDRRR